MSSFENPFRSAAQMIADGDVYRPDRSGEGAGSETAVKERPVPRPTPSAAAGKRIVGDRIGRLSH